MAELFYNAMKYTKKALNIDEIIDSLERDGLLVPNRRSAKKFLSNVGYFRFASYLNFFRDRLSPDFRYKHGVSFEQVRRLYDFDSKLRDLIFSAIQKIEVALRSRIIHQFSLSDGPFWFCDISCATNQYNFSENLSIIERELKRSKEDFIKEHLNVYGDTEFPPAWKTLELASFGCITKLYYNYNRTSEKKIIARGFGVTKTDALDSWIKVINVLRNNCAHHTRIWNRKYLVQPQIPAELPHKWLNNTAFDSRRTYAILCCMAYLLNSIDSHNPFKKSLKSLIKKYPLDSVSYMGFPSDWANEPLWR